MVALKLTVSASKGSPPLSSAPARNCASRSSAVCHSATLAQLPAARVRTWKEQRGVATLVGGGGGREDVLVDARNPSGVARGWW